MPLREYHHKGGDFEVTDKMLADFNDAGYILVRGFLDKEELAKVQQALEGNDAIIKHAFGILNTCDDDCQKDNKCLGSLDNIGDGEGRESKECIWSHPGNDVTGMVGRCEKVVTTCEKLLGGEVYHYHAKLMMKEAFTGGKHVWHQDYGYWYKNGCLFPDMMTVYFSIDDCKKANGCLQILEGSQRCGRIEHLMVAEQTGADMVRVKELEEHLEHLYVETEKGDALFFHSNLLHTAGANTSPNRRWAFLCAYNRTNNNPVYEHHHAQFTPLKKVPNRAIRECTNMMETAGKDFVDPANDKTIRKVDKDASDPKKVNMA